MSQHQDGRRRQTPTEYPWGADGLLHWGEDGYAARRGVEWIPNDPFSGTLRFHDWDRGRSSVRAIWKGADGKEWGMFLADTVEVFQRGLRPGGWTSGFWIVRYQSGYYGLRLATDEERANPPTKTPVQEAT